VEARLKGLRTIQSMSW